MGMLVDEEGEIETSLRPVYESDVEERRVLPKLGRSFSLHLPSPAHFAASVRVIAGWLLPGWLLLGQARTEWRGLLGGNLGHPTKLYLMGQARRVEEEMHRACSGRSRLCLQPSKPTP